MAEGILKSVLAVKRIDNISVNSAGTAGLHDTPASRFAVEAAKIWGVDIQNHLSTALTPKLIESADLILALAANHVDHILKKSSGARSKTFLLKGFPKAFLPGQDDVNDPIGGPLEMYNQTYLELDEHIRKIFADIIRLAEQSGS